MHAHIDFDCTFCSFYYVNKFQLLYPSASMNFYLFIILSSCSLTFFYCTHLGGPSFFQGKGPKRVGALYVTCQLFKIYFKVVSYIYLAFCLSPYSDSVLLGCWLCVHVHAHVY